MLFPFPAQPHVLGQTHVLVSYVMNVHAHLSKMFKTGFQFSTFLNV